MTQPGKIHKSITRITQLIDSRVRKFRGVKTPEAVSWWQSQAASSLSGGGSGGAGGGSGGGGAVTFPEGTDLLTVQLTPASGGADTAVLGLTAFVGGAMCWYTFKRGSNRGGGSFRLWSDGSNVTVGMIEEGGASGPLGVPAEWTAAISSGNVELTCTLDAVIGDGATINLAYITMELIP